MAQHFLDSSALLKRYRHETGSQWLLDLPMRSERLVVARLAHVEVTAAIVRRGKQSSQLPAEVASALSALDNDFAREFQVVEFSDALIARAIQLAKVHALRAADAIQLGCALESRSEPAMAEYYLVSADDELNTAAVAEGLQVENPNLHA